MFEGVASVLEPLIAAKAKERQGTRTDIKETFPESEKQQTRDKLGKIAGVSGKTIDKVKKINDTAPEEVKEKVQTRYT